MKPLSLLFIGNSHTYVNDMPLMVKRRAEEAGFDCRTVMIAHGGWYLAQHAEEPDVRFNILHGNYDYVILQEHAHPCCANGSGRPGVQRSFTQPGQNAMSPAARCS